MHRKFEAPYSLAAISRPTADAKFFECKLYETSSGLDASILLVRMPTLDDGKDKGVDFSSHVSALVSIITYGLDKSTDGCSYGRIDRVCRCFSSRCWTRGFKQERIGIYIQSLLR